jgi:hypothetical protein
VLGGTKLEAIVFGVGVTSGDVPLEVVGADQVLDVKKRRFVVADVDEGGLHAGKHAGDLAEVDVAHRRFSASALRLELSDDAVLDQRDTRLAKLDVDHKQVLRHANL